MCDRARKNFKLSSLVSFLVCIIKSTFIYVPFYSSSDTTVKVSAFSRAFIQTGSKLSGPSMMLCVVVIVDVVEEINIESHFTNHLFMVNSNRF